MNRIEGVTRMYMRDKWSWLAMPWLILALSFAVNLVIGIFLNDEATFYTGALASIFIYVFVLGTVSVHQTFSFVLGLSVRRTDYFLGTLAFIVMLSAVFAVALAILSKLEPATAGWGVHLHLFELPWLSDGAFAARLWIFFAGMLHCFFLGFAAASWYKRFGRNGLIFLMVVVFLALGALGVLLSYLEYWDNIGRALSSMTAVSFFSVWVALPVVVYAAGAFGLLRKAQA